MIRININLLPKELKSKQKEEKLVVLGAMALIAVACVLFAVYSFNSWKLDEEKRQVTMLSEQAKRMDQEIQRLRVYEQRLQAIQRKQQIVDKALEGSVKWSKLLEEIMMVTPNDVSLTSLNGNAEGITFNGQVLDPKDVPDSGHKPVANWLLRLSGINPEPEVWLSSSTKQGNMIVFSNTIKFKRTPTLPAPPNQSGK